jgi:hypothetical protein
MQRLVRANTPSLFLLVAWRTGAAYKTILKPA